MEAPLCTACAPHCQSKGKVKTKNELWIERIQKNTLYFGLELFFLRRNVFILLSLVCLNYSRTEKSYNCLHSRSVSWRNWVFLKILFFFLVFSTSASLQLAVWPRWSQALNSDVFTKHINSSHHCSLSSVHKARLERYDYSKFFSNADWWTCFLRALNFFPSP